MLPSDLAALHGWVNTSLPHKEEWYHSGTKNFVNSLEQVVAVINSVSFNSGAVLDAFPEGVVPSVMDYHEVSNTTDGFTVEHLRFPQDSADAATFIVAPAMHAFNQAMSAEMARTKNGYGQSDIRTVKPLDPELRVLIDAELQQAVDFALQLASSNRSRAGRALAVSYWRVFCRLRGISDLPASFDDARIMKEFAAYLGLVWSQRNGTLGLAGTTVEQYVSQVRRWLEEDYGIDIQSFDALTSKVCKGLKKKDASGKNGLGTMFLPEPTFRFMQDSWDREGTPMALCLRDAQMVRFMMLRRISEVAETSSHKNDSRNLMHDNCSYSPHQFDFLWKVTKNSKNLLRPLQKSSKSMYYERMVDRYYENEKYLARNPSVDRKTLPFFHIDGKPLTRALVERTSSELIFLAFQTEGSIAGHLDPSRYRFNTHSDRKGGATFMLQSVKGIAAMVRWLGDWKSLAFFTYANVTNEFAALSMDQVYDSLS